MKPFKLSLPMFAMLAIGTAILNAAAVAAHWVRGWPAPVRPMALIMVLVATGMLTGCAGLSVNFDAAITYRSDVPLGQRNK